MSLYPVTMRVLIVEDEPKTAQDLRDTLLEIDPTLHILGITDSIEGTLNFLAYPPAPELIFLDIQLADGLSFELFTEVQITCPVVFCTAHDNYALQAFQTNGIAYVLKPFTTQDIRLALDKVKSLAQFYQSNVPDLSALATLLHGQPQSGGLKSNFLVSFRGRFIPVPTKDIALFYILGEDVCLQTFAGNNYLVSHPLDDIEHMVGEQRFYRANRQYLINFELIESVEQDQARKLIIKTKVKCPSPITVSKAKASHFLHWLNMR
jgi:DNA-binding LytR/AlgR family response regulator